MATDPPPDLVLTPLNGEPRGIDDWVTLFPLALVVLDPYTYESAWLLEEAGRILTSFTAADIRVGWLTTSSADEAREFLGPWADKLLTFVDPDREASRPSASRRCRRSWSSTWRRRSRPPPKAGTRPPGGLRCTSSRTSSDGRHP